MNDEEKRIITAFVERMSGNAAIAGFHALARYGLQRIALVDWDVHHGNGTQSAFWSDPRALTISVHQDNCFPPDSGHVH